MKLTHNHKRQNIKIFFKFMIKNNNNNNNN